MNLTNKNDKKTRTSGVASLFGRGSASKIGKSQFSRSMGGIMERLKGLSRKDLAMVGVGLSVLVAAPVAEYMMSKPADSANMLTSGFSSRESASGMASLYEPGINALSQGSADGAGEVITPLSARDPSSLILGAQPEQPPIDYSSMPGSTGSDSPDSNSSSNAPDMDDMRDAARNGASEAVKSAGAPTVIPPMGAGLRSLGMFAEGGSSSVSGNGKSPITTPSKGKNLSPKQSQMVNPVASAGYKGVANTPKSGSKSGIEQLRAQGDAQGGYFSGAKAIEALDNANSVKIKGKVGDLGDGPGDGFGGGGFGHGDGYKGPQKGDHHNSHKHSGKCDTLACQAAEARQKKALEWEFFWKYDLPKDIAKTFINALTKGASDWLVEKIFGGKDGPATMVCAQYIKESVEPACSKGNVRNVMQSANEKTVDSWKTDVCNCGKWTLEDFKEQFGDAKGENNGNDNINNPTQPENNFEGYVADYDTGLKVFMGDLASVRKNSKSQKGVDFAAKAINTYADANKGVGIGYPFNQLYSLVAHEADNDQTGNNANKELLGKVKNSMAASKKEGKDFIDLLEKVNQDPAKYRIAKDGMTVPITDELKAMISKRLEDYKNLYSLYVSSQEAYIDGFEQSFNVLDKYIKESKGVNENIYSEYNGDRNKNNYVSYVLNLSTGLNNSAKKPKERIDAFLEKIDGNPTFDDSMNGTDDNSPKLYFVQTIVKAERILCSPKDDPKGLPENAPSAKIRSWRGMDRDFGTSSKDDAPLKDKFEAEIKKIKEREQTNWKKDSPLDTSYLPKSSEHLAGLMRANSLMSKTEFYAPGYRIVVEIPYALSKSKGKLQSMQSNLDALKEKQKEIIKDLKDNLIDIGGGNGGGDNDGNQGGNGGDQGGGNNGGNGGNQGGNGGDQGGNGQGNIFDSSRKYSVCADPENCTHEEIMAAQRWANDRNKYTKKNKLASPVWEEYKNLAPGMDKNDTEWLNHTGKVHTLRREYDALQAEKDSLRPDLPENKKRLEWINKRLQVIDEEVIKERKAADDRWAYLCTKAGYSTNACKTSKPQNYSSVNHNNTNTTVPKPTNTTPSSTKPTTDEGQTSTGRVPDVLQDIILVNKPQVVPVYDAENNKITVKVCDGLLSEGVPDVCLSYADIKSGANTCFMYTEKDACNRVRNGQLKGWPQKQVDKYGKLIAKKDRKLDGTWHKVQVTATVFDYSLRHSDARNTHMDAPQPLPRLNGTADKEFGANFYSEKKMEEFIFRTNAYCAYSKNSNSWHFKKVTLTAEEGNSSNSIGGSLNVSADVLAVRVSATATYNHSKTTYNFGKEMNYSQNFAGKICK